jgi:hypothetical protein
MWPTPLRDDWDSDAATQADIAELAETLALRRVDLDATAPQVETFAAKYDGDGGR